MKPATLLTACIFIFAAPASAQDNPALTTRKTELSAAWGELLKPLIEEAEIDTASARYIARRCRPPNRGSRRWKA